MQVNKYTSQGFIAGGVVFVPLMVAFQFLGCGVGGGIGPKPDVTFATGKHVVVLVDETAPSIPLSLVLDDPLTRSMRLTGQFHVEPIQSDWVKAKDYDKLLGEAGGAPACLILTRDGHKVYAGRYPTDVRARDALFAKHVTDLPPPQPVAKGLPVVVDRGEEFKVSKDAEGRDYIESHGQRRLLVARGDAIKLGALPRYAESNPVFGKNDWFDLDRRSVCDRSWIKNQGDISSCVGNGGVGTLELSRWYSGQQHIPLSPAFLYAHINGGRDEGAIISDVIGALSEHGTCPFEMLGQRPFYMKQLTADQKKAAQRFKLAKAYQCQTHEEAVSALLAGYSLTFGFQVGPNSGKFDKYGVAGHDRGPGNHCVRADGVRKLPDDRWVYDVVNSWGDTWGPFKNGRVFLDENHLFGGGCRADCVIIKSPIRDPDDPHEPPSYVPSAKAAEPQFQLAS